MEKNLPEYERTKQDLMQKFTPHATYLGSFVQNTISTTSFRPANSSFQVQPAVIRKGAVILVHSGSKARPACIVKVLFDSVCYIPLTSGENVHSLIEGDSRFFGGGYFCKTFDVCTLEYAKNNFIGIYDNPKLVNRAIKELKEYINANLKVN